MRYLVLIIFLLFHQTESFSLLSTDSLELALKNEKADTSRIRILNELIFAYGQQDPQKSLELSKQIIPLLNINGTSLDWALYYNGIGVAYNLKGDYMRSIDMFLKSLELFQSTGDTIHTPRVLNNIGVIFKEIKDFERAKEYYYRSLEIYRRKGNVNAIAVLTNNLGAVYEDIGELDSALIFYHESLFIALKNNLKGREADANLNIGSILVKRRDFQEALKYLLKAYDLDLRNKNESGIIETHTNLGKAYMGLNRLNDAYVHLSKGLQLSLSKDTRELTSRLYLELGSYYYRLKDYKRAYEYHRMYTTLSDSVLNSTTLAKISDLHFQYEKDRKEQEINLLTEINRLKDAQIKSQKDKANLLIFIVLFLFIISGLLWIYFRIYSRANKLLEKNNKLISEQNAELEKQGRKLRELSIEKDNMIGVVAHDLKSPLSKIMGLSNLMRLTGPLSGEQGEYLNLVEKVTSDANKLIGRILDINKLESGNTGPNLSKVNLKSVLDEVSSVFKKSAEDKKIIIHQSCIEDIECVTDKDIVFSILDNLVSNAIKFSEKNKNVILSCYKTNNHVTLSIKDEGPGILTEEIPLLFKKYSRLSARPTGGESSTGLGLAIVELSVEKLNGKIEVISEPKKGSEFIVRLPLS